jgi:hypothetical protein
MYILYSTARRRGGSKEREKEMSQSEGVEMVRPTYTSKAPAVEAKIEEVYLDVAESP